MPDAARGWQGWQGCDLCTIDEVRYEAIAERCSPVVSPIRSDRDAQGVVIVRAVILCEGVGAASNEYLGGDTGNRGDMREWNERGDRDARGDVSDMMW